MKNGKIVVITPYPEKNNIHAKNTGVGSYSYYLYSELNKKREVEIWAQIGEGLTEYENVKRVWLKGVKGILAIIKKCTTERPNIIHIQHEFNMFGEELSLPLSPLIAIIPRLLGVKVITTFHGGIGLKEVDKEFVKENGKKLPPFIIRLAFRYIFGLFSLGSSKIFVHEEFQKQQLVGEHFVSSRKIEVIPHGVPGEVEVVENAKERLNLLGKKVFLYMGFAAKYKGLPELFEIYKEYISKPENKNTVLIIGAGMAPRLENDMEYRNWYLDLKKRYESLGGFVRWVGFIPSDDIPTYYSACDAVLFPYSRRLAASGPMAIAIGYEKNIILSNILEGEQDLSKYAFTFSGPKETLSLKKQRTWDVVARETLVVYNK